MRKLVIALSLAAGTAAHASPCLHVTGGSADDARALERVLVRLVPATPHACVDVEVVSARRAAAAHEATITALVRVVISQERGHIEAVLAGTAIAHVPLTAHGAELATYRRDALEEAVTRLVPAVRAHLEQPRARPPS